MPKILKIALFGIMDAKIRIVQPFVVAFSMA